MEAVFCSNESLVLFFPFYCSMGIRIGKADREIRAALFPMDSGKRDGVFPGAGRRIPDPRSAAGPERQEGGPDRENAGEAVRSPIVMRVFVR